MESWINNHSIMSSHDLLHFGKVVIIFKTVEAETKNRLLASQIKKMAKPSIVTILASYQFWIGLRFGRLSLERQV